MGRLRDTFPPRLADPLYAVRSHVARRNGMVDPAKERRLLREASRAPIAGGAGLACRRVDGGGTSAATAAGATDTAACAPGEIAVGGGGAMTGSVSGRTMIGSVPDADGGGWSASFYNTTGSTQTVTAYAVCCRKA